MRISVIVDGVKIDPACALGIGHLKGDLVVVAIKDDGAPGDAKELGVAWKRIEILREEPHR